MPGSRTTIERPPRPGTLEHSIAGHLTSLQAAYGFCEGHATEFLGQVLLHSALDQADGAHGTHYADAFLAQLGPVRTAELHAFLGALGDDGVEALDAAADLLMAEVRGALLEVLHA